MFRSMKPRPSIVGVRPYIDYKDIDFLQKLLSPQGKLLGRKRIGADAKTQHKVRVAVQRARFMALLPYGT
ncbi:MAG: 30S ribosomal protein S18 [Planctomycetes bacterium]|nr:30S ribosomal protein S18 [Planctomycetota bacterium]